MNFRPLGDRVFVKYNSEGEKTAGGLYIPDTMTYWALSKNKNFIRNSTEV